MRVFSRAERGSCQDPRNCNRAEKTAAVTPVATWLIALVLLGGLFGVTPTLAAEGLPLEGRIVDATGAPLQGARVWLEAPEGRWEEAMRALEGVDRQVHAETRTDGEGRWYLTAPERGFWWVQAEAEGHGARRMRLEPLMEPAKLPELKLFPGHRLELHVHEADGSPAADARVLVDPRVVLRSPRAVESSWELVPHQGRTDSLGKVVLTAQDVQWDRTLYEETHQPWYRSSSSAVFVHRPGEPPFQLRPTMANGASAVSEAAQPPSSRRGTDAQVVEVHLPSTEPALRLRVFDSYAQETVAGAMVAWHSRGEWLAVGLTDAAGEVLVPWLDGQSGRARLRVWTQGHRHADAMEEVVFPSHRPKFGDGEDGELPSATVELSPPPWVVGKVLDDWTGKGLAGAWVWQSGSPGDAVITGPEGEFEIFTYPYEKLEVAMPGYHPTTERFAEFDGPTSVEVVIRLDSTADFVGRVVTGPSSTPVEGAQVRSYRPELDEKGQVQHYSVIGTTTDGDGYFRLPNRRADPADIDIRAAGFRPAVTRNLGMPTGEETDELELVLQPGKVLVGSVLGEGDLPQAGVVIFLHSPDTGGQLRGVTLARTNEAGNFRFDTLRPGIWKAEIEARDGTRTSREVEITEGNIVEHDFRIDDQASD